MGDGGEVGGAPLIKVSNELEGEVGQFVTVCRQDEGAGGRQPQGRPIKGPENPTARRHAVLRASREAAPHAMPKRALFLCFAAPRVALHEVSSDALAAFGAVTVPEKLLGLKFRNDEISKRFVDEKIIIVTPRIKYFQLVRILKVIPSGISGTSSIFCHFTA